MEIHLIKITVNRKQINTFYLPNLSSLQKKNSPEILATIEAASFSAERLLRTSQ